MEPTCKGKVFAGFSANPIGKMYYMCGVFIYDKEIGTQVISDVLAEELIQRLLE